MQRAKLLHRISVTAEIITLRWSRLSSLHWGSGTLDPRGSDLPSTFRRIGKPARLRDWIGQQPGQSEIMLRRCAQPCAALSVSDARLDPELKLTL